MTDHFYQTLQVDAEHGVCAITLNRPQVHNAFDDVLIDELSSALERISSDGAVRAVVISGTGSSFSAGADLNWMQRMVASPEAENKADAMALAQLMQALFELPQTTIAKVNGSAFGGGVGLIACCDIAIGSEEAKFGLTETKLGLVPAVISPYVVHAIGARQAQRWFQTAETFSAKTAKEIGLLHESVPAAELDSAVDRQTALLTKNGPFAVKAAKILAKPPSALRRTREAMDENAGLIARLRVSPEGQEGLNAFLEKRAPNWLDGH